MKKLTEWFAGHKTPERTLRQLNTQTALGALLVQMAKSDDQYHAIEIAQIDSILGAAYSLDPIESAKLRADCEALERHVTDVDAFSAVIRESLPYPDRLVICDAVWAVVMADGIARLAERDTIDRVEKSLGIAHTDSYVVRHKDQPD